MCVYVCMNECMYVYVCSVALRSRTFLCSETFDSIGLESKKRRGHSSNAYAYREQREAVAAAAAV